MMNAKTIDEKFDRRIRRGFTGGIIGLALTIASIPAVHMLRPQLVEQEYYSQPQPIVAVDTNYIHKQFRAHQPLSLDKVIDTSSIATIQKYFALVDSKAYKQESQDFSRIVDTLFTIDIALTLGSCGYGAVMSL